MEVATVLFHQVGQIWFGEVSICRICAESRDLQSGHGFRACSFKTKGNMPDFHTVWGEQTKQKRKTIDEIGRMLVPGALNDTKKIRKASADIFAKSGAEKHGKNVNKSFASGFHQCFRGFGPQRAESIYKRLGPIWI